jgi:hypothetical protein
MPIHVISKEYELPQFQLEVGTNPTFLLKKDGELKYAVINGFLIDLNESNKAVFFKWESKNAMIYR